MHTIIELLGSHLLKVAEEEFLKSEPALQDALMAEVQLLLVKLESWLQAKLPATTGA